jgi:hypothetical protein
VPLRLDEVLQYAHDAVGRDLVQGRSRARAPRATSTARTGGGKPFMSMTDQRSRTSPGAVLP